MTCASSSQTQPQVQRSLIQFIDPKKETQRSLIQFTDPKKETVTCSSSSQTQPQVQRSLIQFTEPKKETMPCSSSSKTHPQVQRRKPNSCSSLKLYSLLKRQENVFKKAGELSTLCGIQVCVISYGPDGQLKTWPQDIEKVKDMARSYIELSDSKRRKGRVGLADIKNKKKKARHVPSSSKFPDWDPRFDSYSVEQLTNLMKSLEHNQTRIQTRLHDVVGAQKQKNINIQNMNMAAYEEQRMMTTMNPLQYHPNQVSSMYLDIYGNSTQQVPELGFNQAQAQSLPLLPAPLTNYPTSNAGQDSSRWFSDTNNMLSYNPGLLVPQGTAMNEFQNTNFNNTDEQKYQWLIAAAAKGIELQNMMNMSGYNGDNTNTNGLPPLPSTTGFSTQPGHF